MQECLRNEPGARGRRPCLLAGARNVPAARPRLAEPLPAHGRRSRTPVHGIVAERGVRRRGAQVAPRGGRAAISLTRPRMACSPAHASAPARGISLGSFASQPDDPGHSAGRAPLTFVFHSHSLRLVIPPVPKASHMSSRSLAPACERSARDAGAFPAPLPGANGGSAPSPASEALAFPRGRDANGRTPSAECPPLPARQRGGQRVSRRHPCSEAGLPRLGDRASAAAAGRHRLRTVCDATPPRGRVRCSRRGARRHPLRGSSGGGQRVSSGPRRRAPSTSKPGSRPGKERRSACPTKSDVPLPA